MILSWCDDPLYLISDLTTLPAGGNYPRWQFASAPAMYSQLGTTISMSHCEASHAQVMLTLTSPLGQRDTNGNLTSLSVAYSDATRSIPQLPQITASCAEDRPPASKRINPSIRGRLRDIATAPKVEGWPVSRGTTSRGHRRRLGGRLGRSDLRRSSFCLFLRYDTRSFVLCVTHFFEPKRRRPDNKPLCRLSSQYYRDALFVDVVSLSNRIS